MGGTGRPGRGGRLPGRQQPGCDGRPPQRPLRTVRVGRRSSDLSVRQARLGAGLTCLAAPLVSGEAGRAWRTVRRDGGAHPSPNAGRMEAAFAGALGVRLGGVNRYGDRVERRPTLGSGPTPGPDDVDRAVRLSLLVGSAAAVLAALVGRR